MNMLSVKCVMEPRDRLELEADDDGYVSVCLMGPHAVDVSTASVMLDRDKARQLRDALSKWLTKGPS